MASRRSFLAPVLGTCVTLATAATLPWSSESSTRGISDAQGNLYVVGSVPTDSVPVTAGAFQTKFNVGICGYGVISSNPLQTVPEPCRHIFAAKVAADGSRVLWATYVESKGNDTLNSFAVDTAGHLFLAGSTNASDFPTTGSVAGLPPPGASPSSFLLELAEDGSRLIFGHSFSTPMYSIVSIAVDNHGGLYAAGNADGSTFPTTDSAYLGARTGAGQDVFVFKLDLASDSMVYSTLLGGSGDDRLVTTIRGTFDVDPAGNVCLAGYTSSLDFPVTPDSFQSPGPLLNLFVAKLNATGSSLTFSSLLGPVTFLFGPSATSLDALAMDASGNAYLAGVEVSGRSLPTSPGAFQSAGSGGRGFAAKFDGQTGKRVYLTYLGDGASFPGGWLIAPGFRWLGLDSGEDQRTAVCHAGAHDARCAATLLEPWHSVHQAS